MTDKVEREFDDLTEEELDFIRNGETEGKCPVCKEGELEPGPKGGMSQNYFCSDKENCGTGFNLAFGFGFSFSQLLWGHRLPSRKAS